MTQHPMLRPLAVSLSVLLSTVAAHAADAPATTRAAQMVIALAGDSTVTDDAGWGLGFAKAMNEKQSVQVVNFSRGGRSSGSFVKEGSWQKVLDLKPDYVLIQFGHNDQPGHGADRESDPATTYTANMTRYVDEARAAGIKPVLVTPVSRRQWGPDGHIHSTLQPYAEAVKKIAGEKKVPLIDLHARSIEVYESLGQEGCKLLSPPKQGGYDGTHFNAAGAETFGPLIAAQLRLEVPVLEKYVRGYIQPNLRAPATRAASTTKVVLPSKPTAPPTAQGARTITVAAGGTADFKTIRDAIAAVPDNNADRTTIHLAPGVYQGQIIVPATKRNVSFVGDDAATTILTYALNVSDPVPPTVPGNLNGNGVVVLGDGFSASNITFRNTSGDHGQAMALRVEADKCVFTNCRLLGWQDTLLVSSGRQYFKDCYIEGRVDFIYGASTVVFDHCEIHTKKGGHITAASTPQDHPYGYVFLNCKITGDGVPADLGRPWRPYAAVAYVNCWMDSHIKPEGWNNWGKPENEKTARYSEYNTTGPGANPDKRFAWTKQLSNAEAEKLTVDAVLGGDDGWKPDAQAGAMITGG